MKYISSKADLTFRLLALNLVKAMASKDNLPIISKDLSWLWRTAYNAGVAGCQDWEELIVAEILDLSREVRYEIWCLSISQHISFIQLVHGTILDYFGCGTGLGAKAIHIALVVYGHFRKM